MNSRFLNLQALGFQFGLAALLLLPGCRGSQSSSAPPGAPSSPSSLSSMAPAAGPVGTPVTFTGLNLKGTQGVTFSPGLAAPFSVESDTRVTATVPPGALTGPLTLVLASGTTLRTGTFTVTDPPPSLASFTPSQGSPYTRVDLAGSGFLGITGIAFGGTPAPQFRILSETALQVAVPPDAVSGPITLLSPGGTAASSRTFAVIPGAPPPPAIQDRTPASGPIGTSVRIVGSGFFAVQTVAFGGAAAPFRILGDGELLLTVPEGATSGPITVTTRPGETAASAPFTVTSDPVGVPTLAAVQPLSGNPGDLVVIQGTHLAGVESATLGGRAARISVVDADLVVLFVPTLDPVSGPIVLNYAGGQATFPTPFTVTFPPPGITAFHPASGPPGTPVTLTGTGLESPTAILFGPTPAPSMISSSPSEIQVLVPAGAATGPVTVRTRGGEVRTAQPFRVTGGSSALDLAIAGLYVTQATQRLDRSVPLVAGRPGQLRVFLRANLPNALSPVVRVSLRDAAGGDLLTQDIPAPGAGVPTTLDEGGTSWDLPLPGNLLQPGTTLQARILPLPGSPPDLDPSDDVFPAGGVPLVLDIRPVAPIGITLVPVNQGGQVGLVTSDTRTLDSWASDIREMFPLNEIDLRVGAVFNFGEAIDDAHPAAFDDLIDQLELARLAGDPANPRYTYGVCALPPGTLVKGNGFTSADPTSTLFRTAAGFDGTRMVTQDTYPRIMAHELGHNLGRSHAPCGVFTLLDTNFPYPFGRIGATGFDGATGEILDPERTADIMGYCQPKWVSDYTFRGIMASRAGSPPPPVAPAPAKGLLVWGTIRDGAVSLEPALEVKASALPPPAGPYTLVLRDGAGQVLLEQPFGAAPLEDSASCGDRRSFIFTLPVPAGVKESLASLEVRDPGASPATRVPLARRQVPARGIALPRDPVAVAWKPGTVHLGWDAGTHPLVLVKNAATGEVIGVARGGSADLLTDAAELDLTLSAGARSVPFRAKVQP